MCRSDFRSKEVPTTSLLSFIINYAARFFRSHGCSSVFIWLVIVPIRLFIFADLHLLISDMVIQVHGFAE